MLVIVMFAFIFSVCVNTKTFNLLIFFLFWNCHRVGKPSHHWTGARSPPAGRGDLRDWGCPGNAGWRGKEKHRVAFDGNIYWDFPFLCKLSVMKWTYDTPLPQVEWLRCSVLSDWYTSKWKLILWPSASQEWIFLNQRKSILLISK